MRCELLLGDCLDLMSQIPNQSVDLVLADLPYEFTNNQWDSLIPLEPLWTHYRRVLKPNGAVVLTAAGPFSGILQCSNLADYRYKWIWVKSRATNFFNVSIQPLRKFEEVLVFYREQPTYNPQMVQGKPYKGGKRSNSRNGNYNAASGQTIIQSSGIRYPDDVLYIPCENKKLHPTQKPLALMEHFTKTYSDPGDLVLDNAMGSGTTGVAALKNGRGFIGIEKYPAIHLTAVKRIQEAFSQKVSL